MEQHHTESIEKIAAVLKKDEAILALLLGGSLAHGYAKSDSDIDLSIIVDSAEYKKRKALGKLVYTNFDICTYKNGYVDGKIIDCEYLKQVAAKGSDPARYAFKDNRILYTKIDTLPALLAEVVRYPLSKKEDRRKRFAAQILAWKWYYSEGTKKENTYIRYLAVQKIILFSGRLILNKNEMLYPYHKWLLKEVEIAPVKPPQVMEEIQAILAAHSIDRINAYCTRTLAFVDLKEEEIDWPNYFLRDSEINWIDHEPPIDDL